MQHVSPARTDFLVAPSAQSYDLVLANPPFGKKSLDVFRLREASLTDLENLPEPDELAEEIIENLEAGVDNFREVSAGLGARLRGAA